MSKLKTGPKIGIVMDPIQHIKPQKNTTMAMMLATQEAGAELFYMEQDDLYLQNNTAFGVVRGIKVFDDDKNWFVLNGPEHMALGDLDVILMRKDPPVDKRFIHTCYMLEHATHDGVRVINNPKSLLAYNEKLLAAYFPEFCPPYTVSSNLEILRNFWKIHERIIIKPLDAMGGQGVFLIEKECLNFEVIWETQTKNGTYPVVAQAFIPEIAKGDARIIIFAGDVFDHVLVRSPKTGSIRGNLSAGGSYDIRPINEREHEIATVVSKKLVKEDIIFAGIDVIGDYLIEVNITSPTCLRELSKFCNIDLGKMLMEKIL